MIAPVLHQSFAHNQIQLLLFAAVTKPARDGALATFLVAIAKPAEIAQAAQAIDCVVETYWNHSPAAKRWC